MIPLAVRVSIGVVAASGTTILAPPTPPKNSTYWVESLFVTVQSCPTSWTVMLSIKTFVMASTLLILKVSETAVKYTTLAPSIRFVVVPAVLLSKPNFPVVMAVSQVNL